LAGPFSWKHTPYLAENTKMLVLVHATALQRLGLSAFEIVFGWPVRCLLACRSFDMRNPSITRFDRKMRDKDGRRVGGQSLIASRFVNDQLREMARGRPREEAYNHARQELLRDGPRIAAAVKFPSGLLSELQPHPLLSLPPSQAMQGILEQQLELLRSRLQTPKTDKRKRSKMHYRTFRDDETNKAVQLRELGRDGGQWGVLRKAAFEAREERLQLAADEGRADQEESGLITDDEMAAYDVSDGTVESTFYAALTEADGMSPEAAAATRTYKSNHGLGQAIAAEAVDRIAERVAKSPGNLNILNAELDKLGVDPKSAEGVTLAHTIRKRVSMAATGWERRFSRLGPQAFAKVQVATAAAAAEQGAFSSSRKMTVQEWEAYEERFPKEQVPLDLDPDVTPYVSREDIELANAQPGPSAKAADASESSDGGDRA
jgi:hypothetical protein